jgi:hypothetical protein
MDSREATRLTLLDGERSSLWYYPKKKIIHHQFRKFVYKEQFRSVLEKGLEAFKTHGACKWLSDDRGHSTLTKEDRLWAANVWTPQVIAAGWKYWAIVMPEKALGQLNMQHWIKVFAEKGVTVRTFMDPDQAMEWLENA